jgi:hypothetical protein
MQSRFPVVPMTIGARRAVHADGQPINPFHPSRAPLVSCRLSEGIEASREASVPRATDLHGHTRE